MPKPNKEFEGWNTSNLDKKSKLLCKFIRKNREFIGHSIMDNICEQMFDLFYDDREE